MTETSGAMESFGHDLRYGLRTLLREPGFAAPIVLTLSLGIGATSATFSVISAVLLRPLPFRNPDRLAVIWKTNAQQAISRSSVSAPDFIDFREQNRVFDDMAA